MSDESTNTEESAAAEDAVGDSILSQTHITETFSSEGPVRSYRAKTTDGRDVSIKVIEASEADADAAAAALDLVQQIDSPNVARVLEHGFTEDGYYIVREWIDGLHLGVSPLPAEWSKPQLAQALASGLDGLAVIHDKGVVHGDVRASNFVVASDGTIKIVDALVPSLFSSAAGDPAEKAWYTSPEELDGGKPTASSDIYRAGLVLFRLMTDRAAFDGLDAAAVAEAHRTQTPLPPSSLTPLAPQALDAVAATALQRDVERRFPSPAAMAMAIRGSLDQPTAKPWWIWVAAAAVALVLVAGGVALWWWLGMASNAAVPRIVGMQRAEAEAALQKAGFVAGKVTEEETLDLAPGTVTTQTPVPGAEVAEGSPVAFAVAALPKVDTPDVVGRPLDEAAGQFAQVGLRVGAVGYANDAAVAAGSVIKQNPAAGDPANVGLGVALLVSMGASPGVVPDVTGMSESDAVAVIEGAGLKAETKAVSSDKVAAGTVVSTKPGAGTAVAAGTKVVLTVSKGPAEAPSSVVPNVIGSGVVEAVRQLLAAKLRIAFSFVEDAANALKVTAMDPPAGATVDAGTRVTISIGLPGWALNQDAPEVPVAAKPVPAPAPTPTAPPAQPAMPATRALPATTPLP